jgi:uncharacterized protein
MASRFAEAPEAAKPFSVRNFTHIYNKLFGSAHMQNQLSARSMSSPFKTLNVETDGAVTTFYAGITSQEHKQIYGDNAGLVVGNIFKQSLDEIAMSPKLHRIASDFEVSHRACELSCDHFGQCSGGFNLTKYARFGTFDATETPECLIHTKTTLEAVIDELQEYAQRVEPNFDGESR